MDYFILKPDGEQTGTFSMEQIRAMLNSGIIGPDTRYWHEGISEWQPIDRIDESINFPEPDPHIPHAPPPHKWTGSLARAIPSPYQQRRPSGPLPEVAAAAPTPVVPAIPEPMRPAEIPAPTLHFETPLPANGTAAPAPAAFSRDQAVAQAPRTPPRRRFRIPLPSATQICAVGLILLTAAIIAAIVASRHPAKSRLSQVTLTAPNPCVLTDQTAVRSLEAEMGDLRSDRTVAMLRRLIATSSDPAFIQTTNVALQNEIARHEGSVTRKYLQAGRAEVIEPGTYGTVAYLDDGGAPVVPHVGAPWVAITYKGTIVYAYLGSDFHLRP